MCVCFCSQYYLIIQHLHYADDYRHAGLHRGGGQGWENSFGFAQDHHNYHDKDAEIVMFFFILRWGNMGEAVVRHEPGKYSKARYQDIGYYRNIL